MLSKPIEDERQNRDGESPPRESEPPSYASQQLFKGQKEILIAHQGASYRLRITRTGGLILNK
jgi:hemin uptake protein HemP